MTRIALMLLAIPLCMLAAAMFSGIEAGMLSLNRARLIHWAKRGVKPARILLSYLKDIQGFLSTILIGNNLVNVIISTLSASAAHTLLKGRAHSGIWEALWAGAMAFAMLYFCEFLPKVLFRRRPLRRTVRACRVFRYAAMALAPLTRLILFLTQWMMPGGASGDAGRSRFMVTRDYLENIVSDRRKGADITAFESIMIRRVLALQNDTAAGIMTPLERVSKVREDAPLRDCFALARETGHIRIPVLSRNGRKFIGVLNALTELSASANPNRACADARLEGAVFVSGREPADNLLAIMRRRHARMLFVEHPKTRRPLGIVTESTILKIMTSGRVGA